MDLSLVTEFKENRETNSKKDQQQQIQQQLIKIEKG